MEKINWQNYEWITQERWGDHHPNGSHVWYDPSQVTIENNILKLGVHYNPKKIESGEIPFGVGLVSCTEKFGYGIFELEAKLPHKQPYAWPAFWMWSWESWPPEIDIIEAYSNSSGSYFNWTGEILLGKIWRCETNIHLGTSPKNYSLGAKKHRFSIVDPSKNFIKYKLVWTENSLEFYYHDKLVRVVDDEQSISQIRGKKMNLIINNSIQKPYSDKTKRYQFEVKNFKYQSL